MQRHQVDETTVGVEIVGRRLVRVLLRNWVTPTDSGRAGAGRPFFGIYLPAHPENRQMAQRSLIGPDERFVAGGMVELDTGTARYLIRFTQTLERQPGLGLDAVLGRAQAHALSAPPARRSGTTRLPDPVRRGGC